MVTSSYRSNTSRPTLSQTGYVRHTLILVLANRQAIMYRLPGIIRRSCQLNTLLVDDGKNSGRTLPLLAAYHNRHDGRRRYCWFGIGSRHGHCLHGLHVTHLFGCHSSEGDTIVGVVIARLRRLPRSPLFRYHCASVYIIVISPDMVRRYRRRQYWRVTVNRMTRTIRSLRMSLFTTVWLLMAHLVIRHHRPEMLAVLLETGYTSNGK